MTKHWSGLEVRKGGALSARKLADDPPAGLTALLDDRLVDLPNPIHGITTKAVPTRKGKRKEPKN